MVLCHHLFFYYLLWSDYISFSLFFFPVMRSLFFLASSFFWNATVALHLEGRGVTLMVMDELFESMCCEFGSLRQVSHSTDHVYSIPSPSVGNLHPLRWRFVYCPFNKGDTHSQCQNWCHLFWVGGGCVCTGIGRLFCYPIFICYPSLLKTHFCTTQLSNYIYFLFILSRKRSRIIPFVRFASLSFYLLIMVLYKPWQQAMLRCYHLMTTTLF